MIGFVTVRSSSTRLREKCFLPFGSELSVIEHIINRTRHFGIEPIVTTTIEKADDRIEDICKRIGVRIFRGSVENKMLRWHKAAQLYGISSFHTIDADDPFFDGRRIKESLVTLETNGFDVVYPSKYSSSGVGSEGYSIRSRFLSSIINTIGDSTDTEMIHDFFGTHNYGILSNEEVWSKFKLLPRLTLDYNEDYVLLNFLAEKLGNNVVVNDLSSYLFTNQALLEINSKCVVKWKEKQNLKSQIKLHEL
jgi:spore coat polysaccharide biosynthesis protein SpsF (cytidylyltransferase family)